MTGYRTVLALALASLGVLAGVVALVAVAAVAIAIERSVSAHRYEQDCRELENEAERIRPLALVTQIQTETARLLLDAGKAGVAKPVAGGEAAPESGLPHLPNIDEIKVWEKP